MALWLVVSAAPAPVPVAAAALVEPVPVLGEATASDDSSAVLQQWRKDVRQALRRFRRTVAYSLQMWVLWLPGLALGGAWLLLVGAWDRSVWQQLRSENVRAAWQQLAAGLAIYLRLLRYPGPPLVGKALVGCALVYAAAVRDLLWDSRLPFGLLDDAALLAIVARSFLWMCPQRCVELQARLVARRQQRRQRRE